jgi:molecular chaperone DnaJ
MFGFGSSKRGGGRRPARGSDLKKQVIISLEEAAKGIELELEIPKNEPCDVCEGSGAEPGSKALTCTACQGKGQVYRSQGFFTISSTCPKCRGEGKIISKPCKPCRGTGIISRAKKLKVKIPAGVNSGSTMRISGEGDIGEYGGPPGDLYVIIEVKTHELFARQGDELYFELPISFTHAALGATVKVPTLDGEHEIEIKAGTQPGDILTLRGKGIKHLRGSGSGDFKIIFRVVIPQKLTKDQAELLRQFAGTMHDDIGERGKGKKKFSLFA